MHKTNLYTESVFLLWKCTLSKTSHAFQQISDLKIFPECFRGPLKTLWRATCRPRACSWMTLF